VYGFAKSDKGNIDQGDLRVFKEMAKDAFSLTDAQIDDQIKKGILIEVL